MYSTSYLPMYHIFKIHVYIVTFTVTCNITCSFALTFGYVTLYRVLVFTQMARMLDVLEIFLNYHGYTYLRLDGATPVTKRQVGHLKCMNSLYQILCQLINIFSAFFVVVLCIPSPVGVNGPVQQRLQALLLHPLHSQWRAGGQPDRSRYCDIL